VNQNANANETSTGSLVEQISKEINGELSDKHIKEFIKESKE
jgi:hypothetical protein